MMDPFIRVPPAHYGGIERVVADLAAGLSKNGHHVTLWAAPGSQVDGPRRAVRPRRRVDALEQHPEHGDGRDAVSPRRWTHSTSSTISAGWRISRRFCPAIVPKVQTYMRTVNPANMVRARRLGARRLHYTAVSAAIRDTGRQGGGDWSVIYNCAAPDRYPFVADTDPSTAPLVFLGRLDRCKGAHHAIAVARQLNRRLIIAGNISPLAHERAYFDADIAPNIDGALVSYIGPVDDEQKRALLGGAAAMLMPIEWEEPFPVVLPESMLCGTPLIAFRRGGVPEGIDHGRTGFLCDTVDEMADCVRRLPEIDRLAVRTDAVRRFSDRAIVDAYESLYRRMAA